MRDPNTYVKNCYGIYDGGFAKPASAQRSLSALFASRAGGIMLQDVMLELGHDRCRALLAQSALQNAGSLTAMATRLCSIAPHGSEQYRAIVDAYAKRAAEQIERW